MDDVQRAWGLAEKHPNCTFIARTGEVVRGHVIGWGEHEAHGPLSLKREIRDLDRKKDAAQRETAAFAADAARLEEMVRESETLRTKLSSELQDLEKAILTMDHRVREMTADFDRAEQRWKVAHAEIERFGEERREIESSLALAEIQVIEIAEAKSSVEAGIQTRLRKSETLRSENELLQRDLAEVQSSLAVLEERRSTAIRESNALRQRAADLEQRGQRAETQIQQAGEQQDQTQAAIRSLDETRYELVRERDRLVEAISAAASNLEELRRVLHETETGWDESRKLLDSWKDRHNALEIEKTQVDSDLKHLASILRR